MRRLLDSHFELYFGKIGIAHRRDVAIAPRLLGDPFHQVITVSTLLGSVASQILSCRTADSSDIADNMGITPGYNFRSIAGFNVTVPNRAFIKRLWGY